MKRRSSLAGLTLAAALTAGCASVPRFKDQAIVWRVDDARDIREPAENEFLNIQYFADIFFLRRLERAMELRTREPARDTNALDELPDSTWFENRIGRRDVSPAEIRRGPGSGPPVPPLTVTGAKAGGNNAGFTLRDARGRKFLVKFDRHENPGMQTGTGAIVGRLFWAMGYNVPSDNVFVFRREDLAIDPKATRGKEKLPYTQAELDATLATSPRRPDGSFRALGSELLSGKPKGGCSPEGIRDDDPNDHVPHEHRRVLRGLRVFSAWLGHTDMKQDNTLDMYVEERGRRFLRHHLIDFGEALAAHAAEKKRDEDGFEHAIDWEQQGKAALALGLWRRPWEGRKQTRWPSIGAFSADDLDPRGWREAYPYFPFFEMDAADAYWAAKIVMRFSRPQIEAAVAAGELGDPAAAAYLVETLLARQRRTGEAYLEAVTPLDELRVSPGLLCGVDLGVRHRLAASGEVERLDDSNQVVDRAVVGPGGDVCLKLPELAEYSVLRLRTRRGGEARPAMQVHLRGGATPRISGVIRVE